MKKFADDLDVVGADATVLLGGGSIGQRGGDRFTGQCPAGAEVRGAVDAPAGVVVADA